MYSSEEYDPINHFKGTIMHNLEYDSNRVLFVDKWNRTQLEVAMNGIFMEGKWNNVYIKGKKLENRMLLCISVCTLNSVFLYVVHPENYRSHHTSAK